MIRSTIPTFYTLRSREEAIIEIAITNWRYEPMNERYVATVEDYAILTEEIPIEGGDGEVTISERKQQFGSKEVYYTNAQIDGLFQMIGNPITVDESYSAELVRLIASALLYVTVTDLYPNGKTVHGLDPNQWVIDENYEKFKKIGNGNKKNI